MPNPVWCLILLVLLAGLTVAVRYRFRSVFLIVLCHNIVWAGALLLIGTNLIAYKEASVWAWLTLAAGLAGFNVGAMVVTWLRERRGASTSSEEAVPAHTHLMNRWTLLGVAIVYAGAFGSYLLTIQLRFGILTLITDPKMVRGAHGESYLESVPLAARILLYLGPLLFVVLGYKAAVDKPLALWLRVVGMVALALSMLALLQRTNLFMAVLWLCAVLITQPLAAPADGRVSDPTPARGLRGRWMALGRPWRIGAALVAFGIVGLLAFQIVGGALDKTGQQALSSGAVSEPLARSGLVSPFQYYTSGTMGFLQLVDSNNHAWPPERVQGSILVGDYNPQTWGASTFGAVLKAIPGAPSVDPISPFINTGVLTNVYTWLEPFYRDFRIYGVVVGSLLLGGVIALLYLRRRASAVMFWLQSAFLSTVFLAPFITKINNTLFLSELVYVVLLSLLYSRVRARRRREGRLATATVAGGADG
ncbi:hypothetical protein GCM10027406_02230 [Leifsonia lichenia]